MPNGMLGDNKALREIFCGSLLGLLERLNGSEGAEWKAALDKFLRRENPWAEARRLLELVKVTDSTASLGFIRRAFVQDDKVFGPLIRTIGPNFTKVFGRGIEVCPPGGRVATHRLLFSSRGTPLLNELEALKARPLDLSDVWALLCRQSRAGLVGDLATNHSLPSRENIFLVSDDNRKKWFLTVWHPGGMGLDSWDIDLKPTTYSERFRAASLVFSRA